MDCRYLALWATISAACALLGGCGSIRTTLFTRMEDESLCQDNVLPLHGVPVMLKVPSHLEVAIEETQYLQYDDMAGQLNVIVLDRPDLNARIQLRYTEKMFLVDPLRPAAGEQFYGFGFAGSTDKRTVEIPNANGELLAGHGYMHSMQYMSNDQTITRSASLLSAAVSFGRSLRPSGNSVASLKANVITSTRTVAFRRFDLASPTVDEEVHSYLEESLNACHACGQPKSPESLPPIAPVTGS